MNFICHLFMFMLSVSCYAIDCAPKGLVDSYYNEISCKQIPMVFISKLEYCI